jgi:hypothetical protein
MSDKELYFELKEMQKSLNRFKAIIIDTDLKPIMDTNNFIESLNTEIENCKNIVALKVGKDYLEKAEIVKPAYIESEEFYDEIPF